MAWNVTATSHATEYLLESVHHFGFIEIAVIIPALLLAYIVLTNIRHYNPTGKLTLPLLGHTLWFISADNPFKDIYGKNDFYSDTSTFKVNLFGKQHNPEMATKKK